MVPSVVTVALQPKSRSALASRAIHIVRDKYYSTRSHNKIPKKLHPRQKVARDKNGGNIAGWKRWKGCRKSTTTRHRDQKEPHGRRTLGRAARPRDQKEPQGRRRAARPPSRKGASASSGVPWRRLPLNILESLGSTCSSPSNPGLLFASSKLSRLRDPPDQRILAAGSTSNLTSASVAMGRPSRSTQPSTIRRLPRICSAAVGTHHCRCRKPCALLP